MRKFNEWNSVKLFLSSPLLLPMWLRSGGGSTTHSASVRTNCFDIHEQSFPRQAVLGCTCITISELMHDCVCMKPCGLSRFLISTLFLSLEHTSYSLSRQAPCDSCCCTLTYLFSMLNLKVLFWWSFTNGIQWNFAYHVHSSDPCISTDGVVQPCPVLLLGQTALISMNRAFLGSQYQAAPALWFLSKCTTLFAWNPADFLVSSFPLCSYHLNTQPIGYLDKPLMIPVAVLERPA